MSSADVDSTIPVTVEKNERAMKLKSEFDTVKNQGKRFAARYFVALVSAGAFGTSVKCGIICSRKFDKRAVRRNRARRLLHEALRQIADRIAPCGVLLIPRREILSVKMDDVKTMLSEVLAKAGVMAS